MLIQSNARGLCHYRNPSFIGISLPARERSLEEAITSLPHGFPPDFHSMIDTFTSILQKCRENWDPFQVMRFHTHMIHMGLEYHTMLGNNMVALFFLELTDMKRAQQVFNKMLPHQDEFLWNSFIKSYVKHGEPHNALLLHSTMKQYASLHPNAHAFIALLKACTLLQDPEIGFRIHAEIAELELEKTDVFISSALVHMYAKCGCLEKARDVFDRLINRDVVHWNALLSGYAEHDRGGDALLCFKEMKKACISPNSVTFVCCLAACSNVGVVEEVQEFHVEIMQKCLEMEVLVGNALVDAYAKLGSLASARAVLDWLPNRDVVSWTSLVAGYAEHDYTAEVRCCLKQMQEEGISLNSITFICVLKSCAKIGDIEESQEVHTDVVKRGLEREALLNNTLIDVYAKCGELQTAKLLFDNFSLRDEVAWTALIAGYVEQGYGEQALGCIENMQYKAIPWNCFTIVCSLKACSIMGADLKGCEIHMEVVCSGYEMDLLIANMLIDMYAKCGLLAMAEEVFEKLPVRNVVSWTTLMTGFSEHGYFEKGFNFLEQMQDEKVPLNIVTYLCSLKICVGIGSKSKGQEMHSEISKKGLEGKAFVGSTLVDMYAKCNSLMEAQFVFDGLPSQTVVAWNALVGGYVEHGHCFAALNHLRAMQEGGVSGDAFTLACNLKACGKTGGATEVHLEIVKKGFERDSLVENVLVDMYARCGSLGEARQVFDEALVRDIVSWNALVAGHVEHGCAEDVCGYVKEMQQIGVLFNVVTFICCLKACATVGDASTGYKLHCACTKRGLEGQLPVGNALIDMYANFGLLPESRDVFDGLGAARDAISWNALAAGFAQIGESEDVLRVLIKMLEEGFEPDSVTFTSVLNACSHAGLMEEGQAAFELIGDRGLRPSRDHYTCVVDLLGRAGCIESAMKMIEEMPFRPSLLQWHTVLAACRKWGDADRGRHAFEHALCLDESNPSAYVYMSNICADIPAPVEANMHGV